MLKEREQFYSKNNSKNIFKNCNKSKNTGNKQQNL